MRLFRPGACAIDWLEHPAFAGRVGMTRCPGTGGGADGLAADIAAIRAEGASVLVTLNEAEELRLAGVATLGAAAARRGLVWHHLPIADFDVPDAAFEARWAEVGGELRQRLAAGESIVIHCYAGLGRTGLVAARLLVEFGQAPMDAMLEIRRARPGAIQTPEQEAYLLRLGPRTGAGAAARRRRPER